MELLVVVPTFADVSDVFLAWKDRLSNKDRIHVLVCSGSGVQEVSGHPVFTLNHELPSRPAWRKVVAQAFARLPRVEELFWIAGLFLIFPRHIIPGLFINARSFDPDLVDFRRMPGGRILKRKFSAIPNIQVLSKGDPQPASRVDTSWRRSGSDTKVSIVLPVYNGARFLRQSIESCLQQSHGNLELVIVDDGSTDETPDIIAEYARRDTRVRAIRNERNLRLPGALNVGFAHATGELLTWTSCDNYYALNAIEALVRYLSTWEDVDFVYSACRNIDEEGRVAPSVRYRPPPWLVPWGSVGPYFLYRRIVYERIGEFRADLEYAEDYDYWLRVFLQFPMMRLHLPLYYYRRHRQSMTAEAEALGLRDTLRMRVRRGALRGRKAKANWP